MGDRETGGDEERDGKPGDSSPGLGPYLRFMHLGTQMTILILAGVFGGIWLDGKWGTDPVATVVGSLAGIGLGLAVVIRDTRSGTRSS